MTERCPFETDCETPCPMGGDIIEVTGACSTDAFGQVCAPVAGYGVLVGQYDRLQTADIVEPIVGTFTFGKVPGGYPPEEVREDWVGVEIPVRKPERIGAGEIAVSPADAFLSLMRGGRLKAAQWFMASGLQLDYLGPTWVFRAGEGVYKELAEPVGSTDFYGSVLDEAAKLFIEETDLSNSVGDSELPPVDVQADILFMQDLMNRNPAVNHAGTPGMLAIDAWRAGKINSLSTFESWLRQMHTRIHFIALPIDFYGPAGRDATRYVGDRQDQPEYTLWVGVNGEQEARAMLDQLGITQQDNLERLKTTGMLILDQ